MVKVDLEHEPSLFSGLPSFPSSWTPESPDDDNEDDFGEDISFSNSLLPDDGLSLSFDAQQRDSAAGPESKKRGRRPPSTAERRASHNAVERARRESLNVRFVELARALPSMATVKRPSKSMIVNKSLEFIFGAEERERLLKEESADLRREVDELRAQLGLPPKNKSSSVVSNRASAPIPINKRVSVSSTHTEDSFSVGLSCSPASTTASYLAASPKELGTPLQQAQAQVSPLIYNNAGSLPQIPPFPAAHQPQSQQQQQHDLHNNHPLLAVTASLYPGGMAIPSPIANQGMPFMDVNYLMALSVQQQQQNCGLAMNLGMSGGLPSWNAYNMAGHGMQSNSMPSNNLPAYTFA